MLTSPRRVIKCHVTVGAWLLVVKKKLCCHNRSLLASHLRVSIKFRRSPLHQHHRHRSSSIILLHQSIAMDMQSKPSTASGSGSKKMEGLVEAAVMMAGGNGTGNVRVLSSSPGIEQPSAATMPMPNSSPSTTPTSDDKKAQTKDVNAARARRLEQNRRAAIESRRRKKVMIAELQKSVAFYTKANESIKTDNLDLEQKLILAKQRIGQIKNGGVVSSTTMALEKENNVASSSIESNLKMSASSQHYPSAATAGHIQTDQILAQLSTTKALCEAMGYPPSVDAMSSSIASNPNTTAVPTGVSSTGSEIVVPQILSSGEDIGSDEYVESLKKVCCVHRVHCIACHRCLHCLALNLYSCNFCICI